MSFIKFIKEKKLGLLLVLDALLLSFYISRHCNLLDLENIRGLIVSYGDISPLVYIIIMATAIVVSPIPSMPLAAASGVIFGPLMGSIYSIIGGTIGAIISFYIARVFGRGFVERVLKTHIDFCDKCTEKYIVYFIFISRLLPIFQFDIISYGAGLTNISLKKFAAATFFGMIPISFLFTYYGQAIFLGSWFTAIISMTIIIAILLVPVLIKKYNVFGLKHKIKLN